MKRPLFQCRACKAPGLCLELQEWNSVQCAPRPSSACLKAGKAKMKLI